MDSSPRNEQTCWCFIHRKYTFIWPSLWLFSWSHYINSQKYWLKKTQKMFHQGCGGRVCHHGDFPFALAVSWQLGEKWVSLICKLGHCVISVYMWEYFMLNPIMRHSTWQFLIALFINCSMTISSTSSTNHIGDNQRDHDAADVTRHHHNSAGDVHHAATGQTVRWLLKWSKPYESQTHLRSI